MKGYNNQLKIKGYEKIKKLGMWDVVETDISYVFTIKITHMDNNFDIINKEIGHSLYRSKTEINDKWVNRMITTLSTEDGEVLNVGSMDISMDEIRDINEFVEILKSMEKEIVK